MGVEPWVITRESNRACFSWERLITIPYPASPSGGWHGFTLRMSRRLNGWRHLGQGRYAQRIVETIARRGLEQSAFVLVNDPETTNFLRQRFPRAKLIHWFQNQLEARPSVRSTLGKSADKVIACSQFTASWVERYYGLKLGSVSVVNNAVNIQQFEPAGHEPAGIPVINFTGRTGIEKAPDLLLRAALQVADQGIRFALQLIGSNHWDRFVEDEYQRLLGSLSGDLERRGIAVRRLGHVGRADLPCEMRKAHIHVVPSRWDEPFGLVTLEAMSCGLATVASRTGGTPEVLGEAGLLFERDSVEELASCLVRLLGNRRLRQSLSRKARQRAELFTWKHTWSQLSGIVEQISVGDWVMKKV